MKFKNNFKRFFTLDRHHEAGFTLVELIVVIAILAILAGVAVPAYSGYLKKAEEAKDLQLLGALNTAFASACLENQISNMDTMIGAKINLDTDGTVNETTPIDFSGSALVAHHSDVITLSSNAGTEPTKADKLNAAFLRYFDGNMNAAFKFYTEIVYAKDGFKGFTAEEAALGGSIVDNGDGTSTITSTSGVQVKVNNSDIENLKDSTFGAMKAEDLLKEVDTVTNLAATMMYTNAGGTVDAMLNDYDFLRFYLANSGIEGVDNLTDDEVDEQLGLLEPDATNLANGAVLYTAQNAGKMDKNDILGFLNESNGTMYQGVVNTMDDGDSATAMTNAALAYGMYIAYNRANGNTDTIDSTKMLAVMTGQSSDSAAFREYLAQAGTEGTQAQKDLDAYLAALNMINNNTEANEGLVNGTIANGFNTTDLQELLGQAMK